MKKILFSIVGVFILGAIVILVGFKSYDESKVYSQKDVSTYGKENEGVKKANITRSEAVQTAKELIKKTLNIDVDKMGFKEEVVLNKDEKQNKFEWEMLWRTKNELDKQMVTIDANTGEIKKFSVNLDRRIDTKEIYKLNKEEIDSKIEDSLKILNKDIKDFKIKYNHENKITYIVHTGSEMKREDIFHHKGGLEEGYAQFVMIKGESENEFMSIVIDAKDKKVKTVHIIDKESDEWNKGKGV